ncbi:MAG: cobalamin B12-binding domain-containing protein [Alphaproteobacteria bacterium]|nr:cobalamin B12-binding domain-containing protein [Alphaproteobacteria bacterium]
MNERETIDRGWYYVVEADGGRWAPEDRRIVADDGRVLTRRLHGWPIRAELVDTSGAALPPATWLRAVAAAGAAVEGTPAEGGHLRLVLGPAGTTPHVGRADDGRVELHLDGPAVAAAPSHHVVDAEVAALLAGVALPPPGAPVAGSLPDRPVPRALFFESLMNTDMPHNDKEISQGVLHMVSPLRDTGTEVVLVNAKMPIVGDDRPVIGLERIEEALASGSIHFVGITLLEGYWEGVVRLIRTLRASGCRAHVAVGGVMPTLAPEHVAAHLDGITFVCRGAGEIFVPRLARILGTSTIDDPFTEAQRRALMEIDGMITVDRAGGRLLSSRSDRTLQVADMDRVELDLSHVQARHIEGGIEITTSRGCIYRCSFCSILGRESYQARSAGSIQDLLELYRRRFAELHPEGIPDNAYRVHISDDDFACDRDRARTFFEALPDSPFRLSSVQVAIGDLCRREGGRLLVEPDHAFLDAIQPRCFADHGRPIPLNDYYEDHKSRDWSSFLQIGVETYSDRELARLGKGYKSIHVRLMVGELARRDLHMDGYFILSNADTEARDLVEVFTEVARLKLRFPRHFHMRFPVVQHLVSYFTAASHRRHQRRGRAHVMRLRGLAAVPGHGELDYPFVDHDEPLDPWVRRTVERTFVTDRGVYTGNLDVLSGMWRSWMDDLAPDDPERVRIGRLIRRLDDRPRRLVFDMLRHAWLGQDEGWPVAALDREVCLQTAERALGPADAWLPVFKHELRADRERRLLLALGGTSDAVIDGALDLLASTDAARVCLHLLAAHGSVEAPRVVEVARRARARLAEEDRPPELRLVIDGDGWQATVEAARELRELGAEVQWVLRVPHLAVPDDLSVLQAAGVETRVVLQVPAEHVDALAPAFTQLADAGVPEVAIELLPEAWEPAQAEQLGTALFALAPRLRVADTTLVLQPVAQRSGHLADVLVDRDGTVGRSDGLVPGQGLRATHRLAHLDDLTNLDRHHLELGDSAALPGAPRLDTLRRRTARAEQVLASFGAWRKRSRPGAPAQPTT